MSSLPLKCQDLCQDLWHYCHGVLNTGHSTFPCESLVERCDLYRSMLNAYESIDDYLSDDELDWYYDKSEPRNEEGMRHDARRILKTVERLELEHKFDAATGIDTNNKPIRR